MTKPISLPSHEPDEERLSPLWRQLAQVLIDASIRLGAREDGSTPDPEVTIPG